MMPTMTTKALPMPEEGCPQRWPRVGSEYQATKFVDSDVAKAEALLDPNTGHTPSGEEEEQQTKKLEEALVALEGEQKYDPHAVSEELRQAIEALEEGDVMEQEEAPEEEEEEEEEKKEEEDSPLWEVCRGSTREEMIQPVRRGGRRWSMDDKRAFHRHLLKHGKVGLATGKVGGVKLEVEGLPGVDRSSLRSYYCMHFKGSLQHLEYKLSDKYIGRCLAAPGSQLLSHVMATGVPMSFHVLDECCECKVKLSNGGASRALRCSTCTNACHAVQRCAQAPLSNTWRCSDCLTRHKAAGLGAEQAIVSDMKHVLAGMTAVTLTPYAAARTYLQDKYESRVRAALCSHVRRNHESRQEDQQERVGGAEAGEKPRGRLTLLESLLQGLSPKRQGEQEGQGPPHKKMKSREEEGLEEKQLEAE